MSVILFNLIEEEFVMNPKTLLIKDRNQEIYANLTHFVSEPKIVTNVVFSNNPVHFYFADVS